MYLDPTFISYALVGLMVLCGFMMGYRWRPTKEQVIEETIVYLIENNFLKAKKVDGEFEILKLNQD